MPQRLRGRCIVTSDDEHAVSTVSAGPSSPSTYATRPEATLLCVPVIRYMSPSGTALAISGKSKFAIPAYTPVLLPRNDDGSIPARSNASHDVSSNNRCCGSIANASRGGTPKNPASKSVAWSRKPPSRT